MNKIQPGNRRRKLLKTIAASSGAIIVGKSLPDTWTKPVINSVLLPAHAQTSGGGGGGGGTTCGPNGLINTFACTNFLPPNSSNFILLEFTISAQGNIDLIITDYPLNTIDTASATVSSTGGFFDVNSDIQGLRVTGTVACNTGPLNLGGVMVTGTMDGINYNATLRGCSG